jgi:ubiquinol oxidase
MAKRSPISTRCDCCRRPTGHVARKANVVRIEGAPTKGRKVGRSKDQQAPLGPIAEAVTDRPPFGPIRRLETPALRAEQVVTLARPRRKASLGASVLFITMDVVYGRARTLEKFRVLELVARVPYQAWENVGYVAMTHTARRPGFARRVFDQVRVNRWEQDNEQWHLLVIEELTAGSPGLGWLRRQAIPQVLAAVYYQVSWLLYVLNPAWSYRLNADFEDHAEHEYALAVNEHLDWETQPFTSEFEDDFGSYASLADVFRQIGYDERLHKEQSESMLRSPRFR